MKAPVFKGVATAVITPFDSDGIDYSSFARHIDFLLTHGTDAIVVCGTTGETPCLDDDEKKRAITFVINQVRHRVPVIAGCGSNNTSSAARLAEYAAEAGADAILSVTPYYNKCTPKGLEEHYRQIALAAGKPVIVYNVPSRTGVNITPETYNRLAEIEWVYGIKEAGTGMADIISTFALVGDKVNIYCGNDDLFLPFLSLGASGAISVCSNVYPMRMKKIYRLFREGKNRLAADEMFKLLPFIRLLFCEPNPICVKAALSLLGYCENRLRLPLTCLEDGHLELLKKEIQRLESE